MAPAPQLVKSLQALRAEANRLYPDRDRTSDGWIGDAAHQLRDSDHNPDDRGLVHAYDLDEDLDGTDDVSGAELMGLVAAIVERRDPRVKYLIYEGLIWRSYNRPGIPAWTPALYTGSNTHVRHLHVSVLSTHQGETDVSPWFPHQLAQLGRASHMQTLTTHPDGRRVDHALIGTDGSVWHAWASTPKGLKTATYEWLGGWGKSIASTWGDGQYLLTVQGSDRPGSSGDNKLFLKWYDEATGTWDPPEPGVWAEHPTAYMRDPEANT